MSHQHATIEDTVYLGFVSNDTSGSGIDGSSPLFDVRLGGALSTAAPVLSGTPTLLTHANYGAGAYEVAVAATAANGFAAGNTYLVYSTLTADGQTPGSCLGSFTLGAIPADVTTWKGTAAATVDSAGYPVVTIKDGTGAGEINTNSGAVALVDTVTTLTGHTAQTGDSFARIGVAGAGLTNIDLPDQTMSITGNLSGSVGSVTGAVASVTGAVGSVTGAVGSVTGSVGSVVGHTAQTGDSYARLGAPAGASVSADVAAVKTVVDGMLTTAMTESYNADGSAPTVAQALHLMIAYLTERSVSGTTVTAKKLDGSTTAATFTLDDGTSPTSVTRAT